VTLAQLPGINVSIQRAQSAIGRGQPLLITGRVTAIGIGLVSLVRVSLEGPSFQPEIANFDTLSTPITGNYSIPIVAPVEGQYTVTARAFPPLAFPIPGLPSPIDFLPALGESTSPPIIVGEVINGVVSLQPPGQPRQRVPAPALTPIEVSPAITIAPQIPITFPAPFGAPTQATVFLLPFAAPGLPTGAPGPTQIISTVAEPLGPPMAQIVSFTIPEA